MGEALVSAESRKTGRKMMTRHFQSTMALFQSFTTAFIMSTTTQARTPAKAFCTTGYSANAVRNMAMTVIMTSEGKALPRPATMPPATPLCRLPTNTEVFTMMMPGRHWPMA